MFTVFKGHFYEFHRERVISRPGQPLSTRSGIEIGPELPIENALRRVVSGQDVYTPGKQEAYQLAMQAQNGRAPLEERPHHPPNPSPTGREDVYFRHYHPGGAHPTDEDGLGHIFFGDRGEGFRPSNG
jgi:hypothetical protein